MESSDDKSGGPPVLVRREKRSSSSPRRSPAAADRDCCRSPSPSNECMQHVYPDVIIVERGGTAAGKRDTPPSRYTRSDDGNDVDRLMTDKTESLMKLCHIGDVNDDDINASLKDYTFMYKKDCAMQSCCDGVVSDNKPVSVDQTDLYDANSDISSVSSSIVDYVRRSLSEVGVESRDEQPPPLPVKTTTKRRAPTLHCDIHTAQQVASDDVITSTWEPTHMTWDEVSCVVGF